MAEQTHMGVLPHHPLNQWAWAFLRKLGLKSLGPKQFAVLHLADLNDPEGLDSDDLLDRLAKREGFLDPPLRLEPLEALGDLSELPFWFPEEDEEGNEWDLQRQRLEFLNQLQEYVDQADPKTWQEARASVQLGLLSLMQEHSTSEGIR